MNRPEPKQYDPVHPEVARLQRKIATARLHPQTPEVLAAIRRHETRIAQLQGQALVPPPVAISRSGRPLGFTW